MLTLFAHVLGAGGLGDSFLTFMPKGPKSLCISARKLGNLFRFTQSSGEQGKRDWRIPIISEKLPQNRRFLSLAAIKCVLTVACGSFLKPCSTIDSLSVVAVDEGCLWCACCYWANCPESLTTSLSDGLFLLWICICTLDSMNLTWFPEGPIMYLYFSWITSTDHAFVPGKAFAYDKSPSPFWNPFCGRLHCNLQQQHSTLLLYPVLACVAADKHIKAAHAPVVSSPVSFFGRGPGFSASVVTAVFFSAKGLPWGSLHRTPIHTQESALTPAISVSARSC